MKLREIRAQLDMEEIIKECERQALPRLREEYAKLQQDYTSSEEERKRLEGESRTKQAEYDSEHKLRMEAESELKKVLEMSQRAETFVNLGLLYISKGREPDAEQAFEKAIEMEPSNITAYIHLGAVLHEQGRMREAELVLKSALNYEPKSAALHNLLGVVYLSQDDVVSAEKEFCRTLTIDNGDAFAMGSISNMHTYRKSALKEGRKQMLN